MRNKQKSPGKVNTEKNRKWRSVLGAFVPQYVPNRIVCSVMSLLSFLHKTSKKKREENLAYNVQKLETKVIPGLDMEAGVSAEVGGICFTPGKYVENQPQWKDIYFGKRSNMAYSGCEILAVYNGLLSLGECVNGDELSELISIFERKGAVWAGLLGTAPRAIRKYFEKRGYAVSLCYARRQDVVNALGETSDTVLAMVYNDGQDIFKMIHTVNISKEKVTGKYVAHNCYKLNAQHQYISDGPFDSLWEAVHRMGQGKSEIVCVMGISK